MSKIKRYKSIQKKSDRDDILYSLNKEDVYGVAVQENIPFPKTDDDWHIITNYINSGLGCWSDVVQIALEEWKNKRKEERD